MRATEFIEARRDAAPRLTVRDQIRAAVRQDGGSPDEYFVRHTDVDRLGYSARQRFGRSPDVDDPEFDVEYIGAGQGRPALWFYPLKWYLSQQEAYATDSPYIWLVRIRPRAWLQPVGPRDREVKPAPQGRERVGILRKSTVPAAIFFQPEFDVVDKIYNYAAQHQRHGEVKGAPAASFFDRVRGYA